MSYKASKGLFPSTFVFLTFKSAHGCILFIFFRILNIFVFGRNMCKNGRKNAKKTAKKREKTKPFVSFYERNERGLFGAKHGCSSKKFRWSSALFLVSLAFRPFFVTSFPLWFFEKFRSETSTKQKKRTSGIRSLMERGPKTSQCWIN